MDVADETNKSAAAAAHGERNDSVADGETLRGMLISRRSTSETRAAADAQQLLVRAFPPSQFPVLCAHIVYRSHVAASVSKQSEAFRPRAHRAK